MRDTNAKPRKEKEIRIIATNRKAHYEYFLTQRHKAGIMLTGTEVKSVRAGKVNMSDAFCYFKYGELWLKNLHIAEYKFGGTQNHIAKGERKLLLKKRELQKLEAKMKEKGTTIVPVEIFISERDLIKVEIALGKGKKHYDKRNSIKDRDMKRDMKRFLKR